MARVVAEGVPHHITQRGNGRRVVFDSDADRLIYLHLLRQYAALHDCKLAGYCLMSNHVHLVAVPGRADSLPIVLRDVHGRYATYLNSRQGASGHAWQGRYFSCPLDGGHLWAALRYVELNPVRAGMVGRADEYGWSSAAAHCGGPDRFGGLDLELWKAEWTADGWMSFLEEASAEEAEAIRRNTHTGRPLGAEEFIRQMEWRLGRSLAPQRGGRRPKERRPAEQERFDFALTE